MKKLKAIFFSIQLNKVVASGKYSTHLLILVRKKALLKTSQTSPVSDFDERKLMVYLHQVENYLYYPKFLCILPKMSRETLLDMARHCEIKRAQLLFVLY